MLDGQINSIAYMNAWSRWLHGESVSNYVLWGIRILWWGRVGKFISLVSASAILAEIIGPVRLRNFGVSLHSHFNFQNIGTSIKNRFAALLFIPRVLTELLGPALKQLGASWRDRPSTFPEAVNELCNVIKTEFAMPRLIAQISKREREAKGFLSTTPGYVSTVLMLAAGILTFVRLYSTKGFWTALVYSSLVLCIGGYLAPVLVVSLQATPMIALLLLDSVVFEPLVLLLKQKSLGKLIKLGSWTLLLIGFQFDLLAS